MDSPQVSIIASVYNGRAYLEGFEKYIDSQSFDDYELIFVVDIRSDDGTLDEVERYCTVNNKARCLLQEGPGKLGGSKNIGLDNSKGKYLWFVDVDDMPSEDFLRRMVEAKESTGSEISICNFEYIGERRWSPGERKDIITMSGQKALHARSLNLIPVTSWAMLYDRDHVISNEIRFREMMSEDIAFTYRILAASEKVCFITEPLYGYYLNQASFCNSRMDERGQSELDNYLYLSEIFSEDQRYLQARFCIIGLRSLTHMTAKGFRTAIKNPELRDNVKKYLPFKGRAEYNLANIFPSLYRWGGSWYIKHFYSRSGKLYVGGSKMKTLRKIAEE